jgi:hypothetical protein
LYKVMKEIATAFGLAMTIKKKGAIESPLFY